MSEFPKSEYAVYLAGPLFDAKQLAGNRLLARAIETASSGRYCVVLPQDLELGGMDAKSIRDADYRALLDCDAAVFQFDGTDLDSGTAAEFMAAKFADIPSVLLRTDFRRAGDRNEQPWNLMFSHFPRTESVVVDAIGLYAETGLMDAMFGRIGDLVSAKLDTALAAPALEGMDRTALRSWLDRAFDL